MADITIPEITIPVGWLLLSFAAVAFGLFLILAAVKHQSRLKKSLSALPDWFQRNYLWFMIPIGVLAIGAGLVFWVFSIVPNVGHILGLLGDEIGKSSDKAEPENIRNLAWAAATLLGAVAIAATLPFQLVKVWTAERNTRTAEQGHVTDRLTRAIEQLGAEKTVRQHRRNNEGTLLYEDGSIDKPDFKKPIITETTEPNLEVRLGAIYALERISQDSERDHITIMETLCAYIRENAPASGAVKIEMPEGGNRQDITKSINKVLKNISTRVDIQAALKILGRRSRERIDFERSTSRNKHNQPYSLDLRNTNFQCASFNGLNMNNSLLIGAQLQNAKLTETRLRKADLREAQLHGANLAEAQLTEANLVGVHLYGANLKGAQMEKVRLKEAHLHGAYL